MPMDAEKVAEGQRARRKKERELAELTNIYFKPVIEDIDAFLWKVESKTAPETLLDTLGSLKLAVDTAIQRTFESLIKETPEVLRDSTAFNIAQNGLSPFRFCSMSLPVNHTGTHGSHPLPRRSIRNTPTKRKK